MGAACGCISKTSSGGKDPSTRSSTVITNKNGVLVGGGNQGSSSINGSAGGPQPETMVIRYIDLTRLKSREEMAQARAKAFEDKKKENQMRGISKESAIEYKLKEKRLQEAEAIKKEKGDNYNMKVSLFPDMSYSHNHSS